MEAVCTLCKPCRAPMTREHIPSLPQLGTEAQPTAATAAAVVPGVAPGSWYLVPGHPAIHPRTDDPASNTKSRLGHCYYAVTASLTPRFYQSLIDRCWRRSGTLLYRPNQKDSCCPHYTLRLDSARFKPAKDQRQSVNRFTNFVLGKTYAKEAARLHPRSRQDSKKRDNEFDLVQRVHEPETRLLRTPPEPAHSFSVALEPDTFTEEKYAVFENYQRVVHQEPPSKISRSGFRGFLCDSPLKRETLVDPDNGKERQLGSFHQCYRLDGKLVAIGVLDLLPSGVSSVYFLYHESIHAHNPGKLGALREISLALEGGYGWWYPGYYIHSCPKMRYKIDYSPQYVLDPETLDWEPLDEGALAIFDKKHYVSLSKERLGLPYDDIRGNREIPEPDKRGGSDAGEIGGGGGDGDDSKASEDHDVDVDDDDDDEDEDDERSLFASNMPAIPSLDQIVETDMGGILIKTDYHENMFSVLDLVAWHSEDFRDYGSLKSRIAELVAALGPDLLGQFCLNFQRSRQ